jgi:hypothetical protein
MDRYPCRARKYNSHKPFLTSLMSNWRREFNNVCAITRLSACSSPRHLQRSRPAFHPSPQQAVPGDGPQLFESHHWAPGHYATSGPTRAVWGLGFRVSGLGFKLPNSRFGERGRQRKRQFVQPVIAAPLNLNSPFPMGLRNSDDAIAQCVVAAMPWSPRSPLKI